MTRYKMFLVLQSKNCLGCDRFIGNLCLRVVLYAKHLISKINNDNLYPTYDVDQSTASVCMYIYICSFVLSLEKYHD